MPRLNRKNPLFWFGGFEGAPFEAVANDDVATTNAGEPVVISPLGNDVATYTINADSIQITEHDNPTTPPTWDSLSKRITYTPPAGAALGSVHVLKYKWTDVQGNESNEATVTITINARAEAWRGYAPSLVCVEQDPPGSGNNTGYKWFQNLEKYYTDDNTPVIPQVLKANDPYVGGIANPDWIEPEFDPVTCPLPGFGAVLFLYNNRAGSNLWKLSLFPEGGGNDVYDINLLPGDPQPRQIPVPEGNYDDFVVLVLEDVDPVDTVHVEVVFTSGVGDGVQDVTSPTGAYAPHFGACVLTPGIAGTVTISD